MIEIQNLYKSFGDKDVLNGISTIFDSGKTNLIIGQSGSGKTVLMKNIVGLLKPTSGDIIYDGRNFVTMDKKEKITLRREMGMIFQSAALFDSLTVLENVMFPLDMFSNMNFRDRVKRAQFCLDRVNLKDVETKFPGELSGGMQKRVAIARAIALNPPKPFATRSIPLVYNPPEYAAPTVNPIFFITLSKIKLAENILLGLYQESSVCCFV